jgi:hypothetical protein
MKMRVIVNGVSYYTTRKAIERRESSCSVLQNTALVVALQGMEDSTGFATSVRVYDGKQIKEYQVQLDVL